MIETSVKPSPDNQFRIVINSVGTARPSVSVAIAKGLGLPASTVIGRMYRAPSVLVDGINATVADRMAGMLTEIGYQAEVQDMATPVPDNVPLYDVAIYIEDARKVQSAVKKLATFIGVSESKATELIFTAPGVVLGSVSEVTVKAFTDHMGPGVSIQSSRPKTALYDIFVKYEEGLVQKRILADMTSAGLKFCGTDDVVAVNVEHSIAQELWRRHQSSGLMRVVNQEFLRFDMVLCDWDEQEQPNEKQTAALEQVAGIPSNLILKVLQSTPITLLESLTNKEMSRRMAEFSELGFNVRAELITFQMLGLEVQSVPQPGPLKKVLVDFGLHDPSQPLPKPPFLVTDMMPELQARITRSALESTGSLVRLVEAS